MAGREELKLDIAAVDIDQGRYLLLIANFNVPYNIVAGDEARYDDILARIAHFVSTNILPLQATFQISATYTLVNTVTNDERVWTGSFSHSSGQSASLSGPLFQDFEVQHFMRETKRCTEQAHIAASLDWSEQDTDWAFLETQSIIVGFQAKLPAHHVFFDRYDLFREQRRGISRCRTLLYPW
jgi:hypothetical protein